MYDIFLSYFHYTHASSAETFDISFYKKRSYSLSKNFACGEQQVANDVAVMESIT